MDEFSHLFCLAHKEDLDFPLPYPIGDKAGQGEGGELVDRPRFLRDLRATLTHNRMPEKWAQRAAAIVEAFLQRHERCQLLTGDAYYGMGAFRLLFDTQEEGGVDAEGQPKEWILFELRYDRLLDTHEALAPPGMPPDDAYDLVKEMRELPLRLRSE